MTALLLSLLVLAVWWMTKPQPPKISTTEFRERLRKQNLGVK